MLSKSLCVCLLLCLLAMSANCAHANDGEMARDVRCVAVGIHIINLGDTEHRAVGTMLTMYYVGKLAGRTPDLDLERAIIKQLGKMKAGEYAGEARRCGAEMSAKGQQLVRIGKDLVRREGKVGTGR
jgi:hypothetical protein